MRTTIQLDPEVYEAARREAQRQNLSIARLLARLVEHGLQAATAPSPPTKRGGRFLAVTPASQDARVSSDQIQKLIDIQGIL